MSDFFKDIMPPITWATLGAVVGILVVHRLDLGKSRVLKREADIKAAQVEIIPPLEKLIATARHFPCPIRIRDDCIRNLGDAYLRFRLHLSGRKLRRLDLAWQALQQIPQTDLCGSSKSGVFDVSDSAQAAELARIQQILAPKLENLRVAIYET
jgi:hypothetical protein